MHKLVICVAPVGMWGKGDNNPITPEEIAEETHQSYLKGASMVHLHVRDTQGNQTSELKAFEKTVQLIREKCDIIIQGSTGGMTALDAEDRCVALNVLGVEMATLNMGSVNFFGGVYINTPEDIVYWAKKMLDKGIKPELCIFEAGMINNVKSLGEKGLLTGTLYYNFSLGFPGALPATLKNLILLVDSIPKESPWLYVEHGIKNFMPIARAIAMGGHIRVGFEDSVWLNNKVKSQSNVELVEKASHIATEMGRDIATVKEARKILGLEEMG